MTDKDQVYVSRITGDNWMGLEIDLVLTPGLNEIAGENMAGKTRVLRTVEALLGKDAWPEIALSQGKTKGSLEIELSEGEPAYVVQWSLTAKGGMRLKCVKKADGSVVKEPQRFLNALCGKMVDPWEFIRLATGNTKERREATDIYKSLVVIKCDIEGFVGRMGHDEIPHVRTLMATYADEPLAFLKAYDAYLGENRKKWKDQVGKLKGTVAMLRDEVPADKRKAEKVSVSALLEEQQGMMELERKHTAAKAEADRLQGLLNAKKIELEQIEVELKHADTDYRALPPYREDEAEKLAARIKNIEKENEIAAQAEKLQASVEKLTQADKQVEKQTRNIERIREFYQETLESAEIPVKGLEVQDEHLIYNGLPLGQASKTEGLRDVSIPIGIALKPGLRTFVIRDADSMTEENRSIVKAACEKYGIQAILELAMSDGPAVLEFQEKGGVFIKDGVAKNT
jgi:hypothetical protein